MDTFKVMQRTPTMEVVEFDGTLEHAQELIEWMQERKPKEGNFEIRASFNRDGGLSVYFFNDWFPDNKVRKGMFVGHNPVLNTFTMFCNRQELDAYWQQV